MTALFLIILLALLIFLTIIFIYARKNKQWAKCVSSYFKFFSKFALIFSVLYFLIIELPQIKRNNYLQNEQRRLYFLELLTNKETTNRIREEAFSKLIKEYNHIDFSGLNLTNKLEGHKSPFNFWRCLKSTGNLKIDQDIIINIRRSKSDYRGDIFLNKINFSNSSLQYANFDGTLIYRPGSFDYWDLSDKEKNKYLLNFHFGDLESTDLSNAILNDVDFDNATLTSVNFNKAMMHQVNLKNANLLYCDLKNTDFLGADFNGIIILKSEINEKTLFTQIENFKKIKLASPMIIERIKITNFKEYLGDWDFDWKKIEDEEMIIKWEKYSQIKKEFPNTYLLEYKNFIKNYYLNINGPDYNWEREL